MVAGPPLVAIDLSLQGKGLSTELAPFQGREGAGYEARVHTASRPAGKLGLTKSWRSL